MIALPPTNDWSVNDANQPRRDVNADLPLVEIITQLRTSIKRTLHLYIKLHLQEVEHDTPAKKCTPITIIVFVYCITCKQFATNKQK